MAWKRAFPLTLAERARRWIMDSGGERMLELDIPRLAVAGLTVSPVVRKGPDTLGSHKE